MEYKVLSSILIPRTGQYYQTGLVLTEKELEQDEIKSLLKKGVLEEIKEEKKPAPKKKVAAKKTTKK